MSDVKVLQNAEGNNPLSDLARIAQNLLVVVSLLAFTLIVNNFIEKHRLPIPQAIATVAIGMLAGLLTLVYPGLKGDALDELEDESARDFMVAFIAPIIFAEGYGLKSRQFFENLTRILSHAFLGTLLSSIVVGVGVYYLPPLTGFAGKFSLPECLCFGALISSTDPVTTLAIFKEQNMVESGLSYLYYTVLGESILNDAVAIVLFDAFGELVSQGNPLTGQAVLHIALTFCVTFVGSLLIGVASGILTALLLKIARFGIGGRDEEHFHFNIPEIGVVLVLSYLPFLIADSLDLSGIVAVMFAGISMRHYAHYNLTQVTRQVFLPIIEFVATMAETYVFLLLGLGVFLLRNDYSLSLILWSALFCLVGRALHVYPFSWLLNRCTHSRRLNLREQTIVWNAGLRGGMSFICALGFPIREGSSSENHATILCTTVVLVGASMVFIGWPTSLLLRVLDIKARPDSRIDLQDSRIVQTPSMFTFRGASMKIEMASKRIERFLMTSDAIIQREARASLAAHETSQRHSSLFPGSPRISQPDFHPFTESVPTLLSSRQLSTGMPIGLVPQVGLVPQGRPSAPVTSLREAVILVAARPSAPAQLAVPIDLRQITPRSSRMLCNP